MTDFRERLDTMLQSIRDMLVEKNTKYGNAALSPPFIFNKASASTGIKQRIDDKLMRIKNSDEPSENDTLDLIGYLILLSINEGFTFKPKR